MDDRLIDKINVQWFPGHMAKARRMMQESVKLVDVVCEIADARIPISSRNPELDGLLAGRPRLLVLNRTELADPAVTSRWIKYFESIGGGALDVFRHRLRPCDDRQGSAWESVDIP